MDDCQDQVSGSLLHQGVVTLGKFPELHPNLPQNGLLAGMDVEGSIHDLKNCPYSFLGTNNKFIVSLHSLLQYSENYVCSKVDLFFPSVA
jgi:hypothetical protein